MSAKAKEQTAGTVTADAGIGIVAEEFSDQCWVVADYRNEAPMWLATDMRWHTRKDAIKGPFFPGEQAANDAAAMVLSGKLLTTIAEDPAPKAVAEPAAPVKEPLTWQTVFDLITSSAEGSDGPIVVVTADGRTLSPDSLIHVKGGFVLSCEGRLPQPVNQPDSQVPITVQGEFLTITFGRPSLDFTRGGALGFAKRVAGIAERM